MNCPNCGCESRLGDQQEEDRRSREDYAAMVAEGRRENGGPMILYVVEALVGEEWKEWMVLAASRDAAIEATGAAELPGVRHTSIEAHHAARQAWVVESPQETPHAGDSK